MSAPLIHPRFMEMHRQFLPSQARIQAKTVTQDDYGQEVETWADKAVMAATRAPLTAQEMQDVGYTVTDQVWSVLLQGAFPFITTRHRLHMDNQDFDIDASETDQTTSVTRLRVRQVGI